MVQTRAAAKLVKGQPLSVEHPLIDEVLDPRTGLIRRVSDVIGDDPMRVQSLRTENAEAKLCGQSVYVCPVCQASLNLNANIYGDKYYFQHVSGGEECELKTATLSKEKLRAIKYNGAKESESHKEMKRFIFDSLSADSNFSEVREEVVVKSLFDESWRKPDVSALFKGSLVAFEVQLSTTFLDEIAARRLFYLANCGFIFWVFKDFDLEIARMSELDIFHINNCNAFVVDEETVEISRRSNAFHLRCIWPEPTLVGGHVEFLRRNKIVDFRSIHLFKTKQSAYYYDFVNNFQKIESNILESKFFMEYEGAVCLEEKLGLALNFLNLPKQDYKLFRLIRAMESAVCGHPVGWKYDNIDQIFNHLFQYEPSFVFIFSVAVGVFGFVFKDREGKIKEKKKKIWDALKSGSNHQFVPDKKYDSFLSICYPLAYNRYASLLASSRMQS